MPRRRRGKVKPPLPRRRFSVNAILDNVFFVFGGVAAIWLAVLLLGDSFSLGWNQVWLVVIFWVVLAYLVLPRLHRILTTLYVPDYFMGRTRTSDGLLGDPVNIALNGSEQQLHTAMAAAGWVRADDVTLGSSWRIITSTILRRSYDEAPVSPLYLFNQKQSFAYQQEVLGNPAKRHHVRFWKCPEGWKLPGGVAVDWLAAGTYDRAVGFSLFTLQITHKIDADTDVERDHILETLEKADAATSVSVIEDFSAGYHARNGGGDTIQTDGDLPIVDLRAIEPTPEADAAGAGGAPVRVLAQETVARDILTPDARMKRPVQTTLGVVLMSLRVLYGVVTLALVFLNWDAHATSVLVDVDGQSIGSEPTVANLVLWIVVAVFGLGVLLYAVLVFLVFLGQNWARIAAMVLSSIDIIVAWIDFADGGPQISLRTNLIGVALEILVVLALSSTMARRYARRTQPPRDRVP
ncbi:LssY-like putative type I secretion system component LssY [Compostimonas suwonensis]|uniref:LssY-like putative type I secretion system component LssY n=1 Tax=Compostimonas suwonensis TaxID=1048394 RepID=A0A2M9C3W5_9MICO|nr:LssY-like putative type I secretion system component LssY [Compostimonas suwonensis]